MNSRKMILGFNKGVGQHGEDDKREDEQAHADG